MKKDVKYRVGYGRFEFFKFDTENIEGWNKSLEAFMNSRGGNFRSFDYKGFHLCIPAPSLNKQDFSSGCLSYKPTMYGRFVEKLENLLK